MSLNKDGFGIKYPMKVDMSLKKKLNQSKLILLTESTLKMYHIVKSGLVGVYGISTIVGYLMPNPLYTNMYQIYMI